MMKALPKVMTATDLFILIHTATEMLILNLVDGDEQNFKSATQTLSKLSAESDYNSLQNG